MYYVNIKRSYVTRHHLIYNTNKTTEKRLRGGKKKKKVRKYKKERTEEVKIHKTLNIYIGKMDVKLRNENKNANIAKNKKLFNVSLDLRPQSLSL